MRQSGDAFDTGVPAQQYGLRPVETAEGTVLVDLSAGEPVGGPIRGTDPESMRQRDAADVAAVEGAKVDVKTRDEYLKREQANRATFEAYAVARDGLLAGLSQTDTGYWAGKIPPITEGQQIAEGGVAAMAPVLKQLFRAAGEGVFTDRDQQLLLDMVPTRDDLEGARLVKMEMIDKLVRAKLNMDEIEILVRARNAIQRGADPAEVDARLEGMGIDPRKR
jgi:hypothetical protein